MKVSKILDIRNILENINTPKMLTMNRSQGKVGGMNPKRSGGELRSRNIA